MIDRCPHCGSDKGAKTTFIGTQYYTWHGEPDGYYHDATDNQSTYVTCIDCGRRVSKKRVFSGTELEIIDEK